MAQKKGEPDKFYLASRDAYDRAEHTSSDQWREMAHLLMEASDLRALVAQAASIMERHREQADEWMERANASLNG